NARRKKSLPLVLRLPILWREIERIVKQPQPRTRQAFLTGSVFCFALEACFYFGIEFFILL
ncbi:MAG: hypothetical protein IJR40_09005, partial [Treponema sp.]|nr:hypothetical protein [Treponema sp.]